MSLIITESADTFDLTQISRGDLLWGKHSTWDEGVAGFVSSATEKVLIVQYHPGIGNVTNHFIIPVEAVLAGSWEIRWSSDLTEVYEYTAEEKSESDDSESDETSEEETSEEETSEEVESDDSGGTYS